MVHSRAKPNAAQRLFRPVAGRFAGFLTSQIDRRRDIAQCRQIGQQMKILEDDPDASAPGLRQSAFAQPRQLAPQQPHAAAAGRLKPRRHRQKRGFARTRRADHGDFLARRHLQRNPPQHLHRSGRAGQRQVQIRDGEHDGAIGNRRIRRDGAIGRRCNDIGAVNQSIHDRWI